MQIQTEWDFYFCTIEEKPASIMVDLALLDLTPIAENPHFIQIAVALNQPNEYGLTTPGEAEVLYIMEDRLAEHMAQNLNGLYAGRNTHDSKRVFYFYGASEVDVDRIVAEVMDQFSEHQYQCDTMADDDWAFYRQFLYPSNLEYQSILNRRVMEKLEQQGVNQIERQEVEHFLYFKSQTAREMFLKRIQHDNFRVIGEGYTEHANRPPYSLVLVREDKVEAQAIDTVVLYLIQQAEICQGEYDGWGTGVVQGK